MKSIDSLLGIPICLFLYLYSNIFSFLKKLFWRKHSQTKGEVRKILVMKYFGMGSIILSVPMFRALRQRFPNASITLLSFEGNREISELLGIADRILTIRTDSILRFFKDFVYILWTIRIERFDLSIDMEFFSKFSLIVSYLSGAPERVGYFVRELWRMGKLMTVKVYYNPYRHMTEVFLALARGVGADTDDFSHVRIRVPERDRRQLDEILGSKGFRKELPLVALNVNAGELSIERRWPSEHFAELARRLQKTYQLQVAFIGIEEDRPYVQGVLQKIDARENVLDLSGVLSLRQLLALFEESILLITNDGGPLHLASLVRTPTIALFGPESPILYAPVGSEATIFYNDLYCSPCLSVYNAKTTECDDNRCMQSITVDEVYESARVKIEGILQRTTKDRF